jgi:hypothetical protein
MNGKSVGIVSPPSVLSAAILIALVLVATFFALLVDYIFEMKAYCAYHGCNLIGQGAYYLWRSRFDFAAPGYTVAAIFLASILLLNQTYKWFSKLLLLFFLSVTLFLVERISLIQDFNIASMAWRSGFIYPVNPELGLLCFVPVLVGVLYLRRSFQSQST